MQCGVGGQWSRSFLFVCGCRSKLLSLAACMLPPVCLPLLCVPPPPNTRPTCFYSQGHCRATSCRGGAGLAPKPRPPPSSTSGSVHHHQLKCHGVWERLPFAEWAVCPVTATGTPPPLPTQICCALVSRAVPCCQCAVLGCPVLRQAGCTALGWAGLGWAGVLNCAVPCRAVGVLCWAVWVGGLGGCVGLTGLPCSDVLPLRQAGLGCAALCCSALSSAGLGRCAVLCCACRAVPGWVGGWVGLDRAAVPCRAVICCAAPGWLG